MWKWILPMVIMGLFGCSLDEQPTKGFYRFTISEKYTPESRLPDRFELLSSGTLVFLTDRFNETVGLSQQYYFCELNPQQMDSVTRMVNVILDSDWDFAEGSSDTLPYYSVRLEVLDDSHRKIYMGIGESLPLNHAAMLEYLRRFIGQAKRYKLKHAYYFATDEVCSRRPEFHSS